MGAVREDVYDEREEEAGEHEADQQHHHGDSQSQSQCHRARDLSPDEREEHQLLEHQHHPVLLLHPAPVIM